MSGEAKCPLLAPSSVTESFNIFLTRLLGNLEGSSFEDILGLHLG